MAIRAYHEHSKGVTKSWLHAYVLHQRHSESPLNFHFWTGVFAIAGALRRKVWIDQRHFQWTPNMYIFLVGPPGVAAKSTTMRGGLSLLKRVEGVDFGPQSGTWQAVLEKFSQATKHIELPSQPEPEPMSCLTIAAGELGTFFRPDDKEFVDLLTDMWDGQKGDFQRTTLKNGTTTIPNPWLNLIGCTTPSWLKDNFREVLIGGGLTSRIVFVYADQKRKYIAYPSQEIETKEYLDEEDYLAHDLQVIGELCGEYKLTPDAFEWGTAWYERMLKAGLPQALASGRFDGYLNRKQTHVHKLAMILAASRRNELVVTRQDLEDAVQHITDLEADMPKVFNSFGQSNGAKINNDVLTLIKNYKTIDYQSLWRICYGTLEMPAYQDAIKAAIQAGYVKQEAMGANNWKLTYLGMKGS